MKRIKSYFFIAAVCLLAHRPLGSCSIVGYIGDVLCKDFIQQGLERLEYRGYDSAGFACIDQAQDLVVIKAEGKLT